MAQVLTLGQTESKPKPEHKPLILELAPFIVAGFAVPFIAWVIEREERRPPR